MMDVDGMGAGTGFWMLGGLLLVVGIVVIVGWLVANASSFGKPAAPRSPGPPAITPQRELPLPRRSRHRRGPPRAVRPGGDHRAGIRAGQADPRPGRMTGRAPLWIGLGLVAAGLLVIAIDRASGTPGSTDAGPFDLNAQTGPGSPGFVAGTVAAPRVVRIAATDGLQFVPASVMVKDGETVTFQVTGAGHVTHEFMVGPAADVAADVPGTPEIADVGMMETRSLTYTFGGPRPVRVRLPRSESLRGGDAGRDRRRSLTSRAGRSTPRRRATQYHGSTD